MMLRLHTLVRRRDLRRVLHLFILIPAVTYFLFGQVVLADSNEVSRDSTNQLAQSSVSLGDTHTCVIVQYENPQCWGSNTYGELGNDLIFSSQVPVTLAAGGRTFKAITSGSGFTCALSNAQEVFCWGRNTNGQLGDGTLTNRRTPVGPVGFSSGVQQISAGLGFTCALLSTASIKCWGLNAYGQLGDNSTVGKLTPSVAVAGLVAAPVSVSAGHSHACALLTTGQVQCWGRNNWGQLGTGTSGIDSIQPASAVNLAGRATAVSTGAYHTCVILENGNVQCWGQNSGGKLGNNLNLHSSSPVNVQGLSDPIRSLSLGESQTCALTDTNEAFCWGGNNFGEIGDSTTTQRWRATPVDGLTDVIALSAGDSHTCAVLLNGDVQCWGSDSSGQLGNGSEGSRTSPGKVFSLSGKVGVTTTIPTSSTSITSSTIKTNSSGNNQSTGKSVTGNGEGSLPRSSSNSLGSNTWQDGSGDVQSGPGDGTTTNNQSDITNVDGETRVRGGTFGVGNSGNYSNLDHKLRLEKNAESFSIIILILAIVLIALSSQHKKTGHDPLPPKYFWLFGMPKSRNTQSEPEQNDSKEGPFDDFKTPRAMTAEDGALLELGPKFLGRLFVYEIFVIQTLSKFRILRVGLRRWAELSLLSPVVAALFPLSIFLSATFLGIMISNNEFSEVVAVSILFLFSVLMPVFSIIAICGWFLGRFSSEMSVVEQALEAILLLICFGFTPLAMRVLIGPTWKSLRRGLIFPTIVAMMVAFWSFTSFIENLSTQIGTYSKKFSTNSDGPVEYLTFNGENTYLFVVTALVLTILVSFSAVWFSDYQGRPVIFLNSLHSRKSPEYLLRREFVENARVELKEGSPLMQALQYVLAGSAMIFLMWDITFGWTIPIVVSFLSGYFLIVKTKVKSRSRTIHPASRAAILLVVMYGASSIMKNYAIVGTVVIGVVCLMFLFIRPRQLWSQ